MSHCSSWFYTVLTYTYTAHTTQFNHCELLEVAGFSDFPKNALIMAMRQRCSKKKNMKSLVQKKPHVIPCLLPTCSHYQLCYRSPCWELQGQLPHHCINIHSWNTIMHLASACKYNTAITPQHKTELTPSPSYCILGLCVCVYFHVCMRFSVHTLLQGGFSFSLHQLPARPASALVVVW